MSSKIYFSAPSTPPVTLAAVRSKVVVLLLLIHCLLLLHLFVEILFWSLYCCVVLCVLSSFAISPLGKGERVA